MNDFREFSNKPSNTDVIENYLPEHLLPAYRSFEDSKERYFDIFKITGYSQIERRQKLRKMFSSPFGLSYKPGNSDWQKPSPYCD